MPFATIDITPADDGTPTTDSRLIDAVHPNPSYVFAIMAYVKDGSASTGEYLIQAGTYKHLPAKGGFTTCPLSEYVYDGHFPTWTGRIPIGPGLGIWARGRALAADITVRVIFTIEKNDP